METFTFGLYFVGVALTLVLAKMVFRCKHKWELVSDREFHPSIDDVVKALRSLVGMPFDMVERMSRDRMYVAILRCDKCGGTKKFEVRR